MPGGPPAPPPGQPPQAAHLSLDAWNLMGGLDWAALDTVAELQGVQNPELWLHLLTVIRRFKSDG